MAQFLSDHSFENFKDLIYKESGITFSATNRSILESRLKDRLRENKMEHVDDYYKILLSDKEELKRMLDSVTTNLTRFFRNQPHFDSLVHYVIPKLVKLKRENPMEKKEIRIWSAGCSTGEEPYTIAMIMKEHLPAEFSVEILASDISFKSLVVAKQGFYPENRVIGVPEEYLSKYFTQQANGYQINADIKEMVAFDYHNLTNDANNRNIDILFCRNVIIYFDEAAQQAVINRFWDAMSRHSFLFIGHSESLFGMQTNFEFLKTDWACLYQKNT